MYYPQSQIKTNLYTNGGEFALTTTKQEYVGYYWTTSSGKTYTGKTPNDINIVELTSLSKTSLPINAQSTDNTVFYNLDQTNSTYNNIKNIDTKTLFIPTYYLPTPTPQDYQTGEFQRYFVKKINELIYTEVSEDTYNKINSHDSTYLWQYYTPFILPWFISGDKLIVAQTNNKIVEVTMQRLKLYKFNEYLGKDYIKFYK
jgi:hypothetical protein